MLTRKNYTDHLEVKFELTDERLLENYAALDELRNSAVNRLRSVLGIDAKVTLVQPRSLERYEGKAKRIVDLREGQI